jgi:hypothetical protein
MAVGVVLLIVGWIDVSGTEFVAKQIPYVISAGLGGVVALLIGGTLWLSADLRDEWRVLDRMEEHLVKGDELVDELEARIAVLEERVGSDQTPRDPEANGGGLHRRKSGAVAQ